MTLSQHLAKIDFKTRSQNFNWKLPEPVAGDAVKRSQTRATVPRRPSRVEETGTEGNSEGQHAARHHPELGNAAWGQAYYTKKRKENTSFSPRSLTPAGFLPSEPGT